VFGRDKQRRRIGERLAVEEQAKIDVAVRREQGQVHPPLRVADAQPLGQQVQLATADRRAAAEERPPCLPHAQSFLVRAAARKALQNPVAIECTRTGTQRHTDRPKPAMPIGAHVSTSGGLPLAVPRAVTMGAECMQIFVASPQRRDNPRHTDQQVADFTLQVRAVGIGPNFAHARYLINLASLRPEHPSACDRCPLHLRHLGRAL